MSLLLSLAVLAQAVPAEEPVAPYAQSNANAGATSFAGDAMWRAFGGAEGVDRLIADFITRTRADPRIADIFKGQDMVRFRRVLTEQFCYILNGGCGYSGRDMRTAHKDMGLQTADMGALVENLQAAMRAGGIPFAAQNRFLAKLAPMKRRIVER